MKIENELGKKSRVDLVVLARKLEIKGISNSNKAQIIESILSTDQKAVLRELNLSFWKRHRNSIFGWASVIGLILTVIFYFEPFRSSKSEKTNLSDTLKFSKHQDLYNQSTKAFGDIYTAYDTLIEQLNNEYLLTAGSYKDISNKFKDAINSFEIYKKSIKKYCTTEQVRIANGVLSWLWNDYRSLTQHVSKIEQLNNRVADTLFADRPQGEQVKDILEFIEPELLNLIAFENNLYFSVRDYNREIIRSLESYLSHEFRVSLGLGEEQTMIEDINNIPDLITQSNSFKFEQEKIPFVLSESRSNFSSSISFGEGVLDLLNDKEQYLRSEANLKFILDVIESNDELKAHMLAIKEKSELEQNKSYGNSNIDPQPKIDVDAPNRLLKQEK